MSAAALLLAAHLAGPVTLAADFDIPWYQAHPADRAETLARCRKDVALANTRECQNAELAGYGHRWELAPKDRPPPMNDPWGRRGAHGRGA